MFFQKYKKIILIIVVLIIAFFVYSNYFGSASQQEELLTSSAQPNANQVVGTEIVSALNQIESLKLSRDIFEDPVFQSLRDRSEDIPAEPIGKPNPFSPIGSTAVRQTTTPTPTTNTPRSNTIINTTNQPASQPVI